MINYIPIDQQSSTSHNQFPQGPQSFHCSDGFHMVPHGSTCSPLPLPAALHQGQPERPILLRESLENLGVKQWKTLENRGMICGSKATRCNKCIWSLKFFLKHAGAEKTKTNPSECLECRFRAVFDAICHLVFCLAGPATIPVESLCWSFKAKSLRWTQNSGLKAYGCMWNPDHCWVISCNTIKIIIAMKSQCCWVTTNCYH